MGKILSSIFGILIFIWICIFVYEFIRFSNNQEPLICISEKKYDYFDGSVDVCIGLGYKVVNYNRASIKEKQIGPFWTELKKSNVD